jgi:hypothetical protein
MLAAVRSAHERFHCRAAYVLDTNQRIYQFTGANGGLDRLGATHSLDLPRSFRYGPHLATLATHALQIFKPKYREAGALSIVGSGPGTKIKCRKPASMYTTALAGTGSVTLLGRRNDTILAELMDVVLGNEGRRGGAVETCPIAFVGGQEKIHKLFSICLDLWKLKARGDRSGGPPIEYTSSWKKYLKTKYRYTKVEEEAKERLFVDLMTGCTVVNKYEGQVVEAYTRLFGPAGRAEAYDPERSREGRIVVSTVHKAKGLGWDNVCVKRRLLLALRPREYCNY